MRIRRRGNREGSTPFFWSAAACCRLAAERRQQAAAPRKKKPAARATGLQDSSEKLLRFVLLHFLFLRLFLLHFAGRCFPGGVVAAVERQVAVVNFEGQDRQRRG